MVKANSVTINFDDTNFLYDTTLTYLNGMIFYKDSLNLIKYYLKQNRHCIDDKIYEQLMLFIDRVYIIERSDK